MAAILALKDKFGAGGHVGVVRAEDQDHLEAVDQLAEALDDLVQGLVGVRAGRLVGDAEGFFIGLMDARLRDEQFDDHVAARFATAGGGPRFTTAGGGPRFTTAGGGQWPEHPDGADLTYQRVEQAQRDRGLAGQTLGRRDIHTPAHSRRLSTPPGER